MRFLLLSLSAAFALGEATFLSAAEASRPASTKPSTPPAAPAAESEDAANSKRPSFFTRLFSNRPRETEQPQAAAPAEKKSQSAPAHKQEPNPETKAESKPTLKKSVAKEKAPEPSKTEEERFEAARKTAAEDPKISELRTKAEASPNNAESNRLMRAYLRSLYGKMRTLEPTLAERIDLTEKAALKLVPGSE